FELDGRSYDDPAYGERDKDSPDPRETVLDTLPLAQGTTLTYLYDFGDDWIHQLTLEGMAPSDESLSGPMLLGGAGACPPDNSGGPGGYAELRAALKQKDSPEAQAALEKLGGRTDP